MVCWQVKLCDPHLSTLEVRFSRRGAIQIYVYLYLYLVFKAWLLFEARLLLVQSSQTPACIQGSACIQGCTENVYMKVDSAKHSFSVSSTIHQGQRVDVGLLKNVKMHKTTH